MKSVGRYALYQAIASGGMATIYLGRLIGPVGFARTVAVKRLHPYYATDQRFTSMFLDEARLAGRIRHPNVVPTVDVVTTNGELFLVMEYVHGESLARLVRVASEKGTPMPVPVVAAILSGALQGLSAAHEATSERGEPLQIIHRDVSPQNILVGLDGQARLIDFGVAHAEGRLHTTQTGQVKGKIAYMSPEQLRGETISPTTDLYAAAVVMWEALTGRRLFKADGDGGLVVQVLEAQVIPPSEALRAVGDEARAAAVAPLDTVVMRGLARGSEARWLTARDFARALESAVVPATAAQVADWVESAAGDVLRERAAIIAEIESRSAHDLTTGEFLTAIAHGSGDEVRNDAPTASVPANVAARASEVPAPSMEPATVEAPPPVRPHEPSVRAPLFIEAALADFSSPASSPRGFGPVVDTMVSVVAPAASTEASAAGKPLPAHLGRTLQSVIAPPSDREAARRAIVARPPVPVVEVVEVASVRGARDAEKAREPPPSVIQLPITRIPRVALVGVVVLLLIGLRLLLWHGSH